MRSPITKPPTKRQLELLAFIKTTVAEKGYSPTIREIGARMCIKSTNGVIDHLRALERRGLITRNPTKSRTVVLKPEPVTVTDDDVLLDEAIAHAAECNVTDIDTRIVGYLRELKARRAAT